MDELIVRHKLDVVASLDVREIIRRLFAAGCKQTRARH